MNSFALISWLIFLFRLRNIQTQNFIWIFNIGSSIAYKIHILVLVCPILMYNDVFNFRVKFHVNFPHLLIMQKAMSTSMPSTKTKTTNGIVIKRPAVKDEQINQSLLYSVLSIFRFYIYELWMILDRERAHIKKYTRYNVHWICFILCVCVCEFRVICLCRIKWFRTLQSLNIWREKKSEFIANLWCATATNNS